MDIAGLLGCLAIVATTGWGQLLVGPAEGEINPSVRMRQLLNQSSNCGPEPMVEDDWQRIWSTGQPAHLHPQRIHGGIQ
jgi:hypothetical protein